VYLVWPNVSFVKGSVSEILFCAFNDKDLRGHDVNEYRCSRQDSGGTHDWLLGVDTDRERVVLIWIKDGKWYRMICLCLDAGPYGVYTLLITSFVSSPTS